jgi:hypothetical protein
LAQIPGGERKEGRGGGEERRRKGDRPKENQLKQPKKKQIVFGRHPEIPTIILTKNSPPNEKLRMPKRL